MAVMTWLLMVWSASVFASRGRPTQCDGQSLRVWLKPAFRGDCP